MGVGTAWLIASLTREATLLALAGLAIGGIDDLAVDLIWIVLCCWRRMTAGRHPRATAATLPPPRAPGSIAIFVPAWREADVIGPMLRHALRVIEHDAYRIYVGTYANDPATAAAVEAVGDARVRLVRGRIDGPTTKAECLNRLWAAMCADERASAVPFKAVVLHDAEDVVHGQELRVFDALIERFDLVQLPVLPLIHPRSRWVSAHYADEFAEAHGRQLAVRQALGAGIPSAGVGCALGRRALALLAAGNGGRPFDESSLTEDYELGLRLKAAGGTAAFVALWSRAGGELVAVRAYFPPTLAAAVRQKTRWIIGIALAGWDRLRWRGGLGERWMLLRDRRSVFAAAILALSYSVLPLSALCWLVGARVGWPAWTAPLLTANLALLAWRVAMRCATVARFYGSREGLRAVPRIVVGNLILMAAAWRAIRAYVPGVVPPWDKTAHDFPENAACE